MQTILHDPKKDGPLSLKNDGKLELFFIGTGSAIARPPLRQTNFLIIKGDTHIAVDFGTTGQIALEEATGLGLTDIEVILPTHSHDDHVGGTGGLAIANRYVGQPFMKKPKLKMIITPQYQPVLWDRTLRGGLEYNEELGSRARYLDLTDYFDIVHPTWMRNKPREVFEIVFGEIRLELFRTKHIPDNVIDWQKSFISYGLWIDNRVFVSVDTRFDRDLIEMYEDRSEFLFHDCQLFDPETVHATLTDLQKIPKDIRKRMFLMHYGNNWQNFEARANSEFLGFAKQGIRYIFD